MYMKISLLENELLNKDCFNTIIYINRNLRRGVLNEYIEKDSTAILYSIYSSNYM